MAKITEKLKRKPGGKRSAGALDKLEEKVGAKKFAELVAFVTKCQAVRMNPGEVKAAVRAKFGQDIELDRFIFILI